MNVRLSPGKYVVAVSGGVDSMVLLDVLRRRLDLELVVAHFDHGIRSDSHTDRQLVQEAATRWNLPFCYEEGHLGPGASEARARQVRYAFLRRVKERTGAAAIVTAHHQDDALETAALNLLRGTGRKGLTALRSHDDLIRPFLHLTKQEITAYARRHRIQWHEESTNQQDYYLRNYLRHRILPKLSAAQRTQLLAHITTLRQANDDIDLLLDTLLNRQPDPATLDRGWFINLPHAVAREVIAAWLRRNDIRDFTKKTIERLVAAAKTAVPGKRADINAGFFLHIGKDVLQITARNPS